MAFDEKYPCLKGHVSLRILETMPTPMQHANQAENQARQIEQMHTTPAKDILLIRPLQPEDSITALTQILHLAYAEMANMGLRYLASHQDDATTRRRLSEGFPWVVEFEKRLIGTVTLALPDPDSKCPWYRQTGVYSIGQFGVLPEFQGSGIGRRLVDCLEEQARQLGGHELALDTAEGAIHLRQWYERLGFRFIEFVSWDVTTYRSVVLSKPLSSRSEALEKLDF